jgi:fumarate reductase subunit C
MSVYTEYHQRWLRRPVSTYWWLEKPSYFAFILREGSCMFVGWFVLYLLLLMRATVQGETAYRTFLAWSATPGILILNAVTLVFVLYHAITFFTAAPQAMVVHVGAKRVPGSLVRAGHYAAWAVVSAFVSWIVLTSGSG